MLVTLNKLTINDLEFLLEIRNDPSTRNYLENPSIFTLDQCKEWFRETSPRWLLILNESGERVGYLRINGHEIGCDIHPKFRRMGYARQAYEQYLSGVEFASLWVFRDNFAFDLYKKLGFIETGEVKQIRNREYLRMEFLSSKNE